MTKTEITQECIQVDTTEGVRYQITTVVVVAGELPDVYLFVHDIVDALDPKQDSFVRVGSPYDLENVIVGRDAAISAGLTRYRTNSFVVRYADIQVAVQAKQAIAQRVDTAINTWYTYKTDFESSPPVISYRPETDEEYLQTLINEYKAAVTAREEAETAVVDAQTAVTTAVAAASLAEQKVQIYQNETTFCQKARTTYWQGTPGINTGVTAFSASSQYFFQQMVSWFNANNPDPTHWFYPGGIPDPGIWYTFYHELETMGLAMATWLATSPYMAMMDGELASFCTGASSGYGAALSAKVSADVAVSTAQTAKEKADATLAAAQETEDAALAAVRDACPTYSPTA